jgi:hypothetical protein
MPREEEKKACWMQDDENRQLNVKKLRQKSPDQIPCRRFGVTTDANCIIGKQAKERARRWL